MWRWNIWTINSCIVNYFDEISCKINLWNDKHKTVIKSTAGFRKMLRTAQSKNERKIAVSCAQIAPSSTRMRSFALITPQICWALESANICAQLCSFALICIQLRRICASSAFKKIWCWVAPTCGIISFQLMSDKVMIQHIMIMEYAKAGEATYQGFFLSITSVLVNIFARNSQEMFMGSGGWGPRRKFCKNMKLKWCSREELAIF